MLSNYSPASCLTSFELSWLNVSRQILQPISVSWQVQELVLEYAALIDAHFGKLLNFVQRNNWRTNPNILVGARVAVFRKGATLTPTVVTGLVIHSWRSTMRVRPRLSKSPIFFMLFTTIFIFSYSSNSHA